MKKKLFLPIILLLFIGCSLIFSACSQHFNFDKSSTVNLKYTCVEEEKNFYTELNAEQSHNLILSLNKTAYTEIIDESINFGPSYDSLTIKINNDTLKLYDVWNIIYNGGYFYFNGKLYESKVKFDFLATYLNENNPDTIPESVSFEVQYVKSRIGAEENYQIIKSVSQLNNYIETEIRNIDLPDIVLFKDEVIDKYNDEYFENSFIVIFMKAASSGSYGFKVNDVYISSDRLIIDYEIVRPSDPDVGVTGDMAYWYSFVELSEEYNTIKNVDLVSLR